MNSFGQCPKGSRVQWEPTNKPGAVYAGEVVAHIPRGQNIYDTRDYEEHKAGRPGATSERDRVLVRADHDGKWHAQDLGSLR
jgi:hypothetical protein